jgi:cell division septation protein DedD
MEPWVSVALLGVAIFGFAWLTPKQRREQQDGGSDPAYDRLLEELETENRELLDAVTKFKQEQDETIKGLVEQIRTLERQMGEMNARAAAFSAATNAPVSEQSAGSSQGQNQPASQSPAEAAASGVQPATQAGSPAPVSAMPISIRERYAELLALHRKGRSIEQIARTAGMNKGEVQLILQLARREEEQFA